MQIYEKKLFGSVRWRRKGRRIFRGPRPSHSAPPFSAHGFGRPAACGPEASGQWPSVRPAARPAARCRPETGAPLQRRSSAVLRLAPTAASRRPLQHCALRRMQMPAPAAEEKRLLYRHGRPKINVLKDTLSFNYNSAFLTVD